MRFEDLNHDALNYDPKKAHKERVIQHTDQFHGFIMAHLDKISILTKMLKSQTRYGRPIDVQEFWEFQNITTCIAQYEQDNLNNPDKIIFPDDFAHQFNSFIKAANQLHLQYKQDEVKATKDKIEYITQGMQLMNYTLEATDKVLYPERCAQIEETLLLSEETLRRLHEKLALDELSLNTIEWTFLN
jgi:hypothetical protein